MNAHIFRKARIMALSIQLWRKRLVFWCGALMVGAVSSYFAIAADNASH